MSPLSKPRHQTVSQWRAEAVEPDEQATAEGKDDLVPAAPHGPGNAAGDFSGSHCAETTARLFLVAEDVVEKLALRGAGTDEEDVDFVLGQFGPEGIAKAVQGELAGTVLAFERDRPVAEDGTHIHDQREIPLAENRECRARKFHGGKKVDLHDLSEACFVRLFKRSNRADSGVVNEAIESAEILLAKL